MLQSVDINFSSAVNLINTVRADVTELRSQDENFNNLYMDAVQLCEMSGIEANFVAVSSARKGKLPSKFVGSCVLETVGDRPDVTSKEGFKVNVCYAVLDSLLSEIERRFTESHCNVLIGIHALNPTSEKFADFTALKPFANAYGGNETDLSHKLHPAKRLLERLDSVEKPKSMLALIWCLERYKEAFQELYM